MEVFSKSTNDTKKLAERVAQNLKAEDIILLYGNLGSGKTTFTQFLAKALGSKDKVVSPTFILQKEYECESRGIKKINHLDLYRITDEEEITANGLADFLNDREAVSIIEWPEKIEKFISASFSLDSRRSLHRTTIRGGNDGVVIPHSRHVIPHLMRDPSSYIKIAFEYVSENERKINVSNLS